MAQDGGLEFGQRQREAGVAGVARRFKEAAAHARQYLPIGRQRAGGVVQVAFGDAAAHVADDVLQVLGLAAVDVARQVEVEVVLRVGDLGQRHQAGVAWHVHLAGEGVDDAVDVLLAQSVLVAVLDVALAGVDHEDATLLTLAGRGAGLVQHQDAGWNAGAIEQVGRQADDPFQDAGADELPSDDSLCVATKQHAVRQDAGATAGALHRADDVKQVGVVTLLGGRHAPSETLVRVVGRRQTGAPGLVAELRVGDHDVVGAQLMTIQELRVRQRVPGQDAGGGEVVQDHVHAGQAGGAHVHLLAFQGDVRAGLGRHLQQQRARTAGGVVGGGRCLGVGP